MADGWIGAGKGALSGAASGAALGSYVPGIGTAIGGLGGALAGGLLGYFSGGEKTGKPQTQTSTGQGMQQGMPKIPGYEAGRLPQYTPEQMQLFQQTFGQYGPESYLGRLAGGSPEMWEQLEAPALQQYAALQGGLASRFSGAGTGARRSSGFQQAATSEAQNFAQQLQAQRLGLQRQAIGDLASIQNQLLGYRPYEQYIVPQQRSTLQGLAEGIVPPLMTGAGIIGGLWGAKKLGLF